MRIDTIYELYEMISKGSEKILERKQSISLRKSALSSIGGIQKMAFDTRRIDQEVDYIPRRGLQNYHRSEKFISDSMAAKIAGFGKLSSLLNQLKLEYGKEPEWQDSYTRVLASAVDKGLRTQEADGDFSDSQPSMASLDYLEELMYVRYRIGATDLMTMGEDKLRDVILSKDEMLVRKGFSPSVSAPAIISTGDVSKYSYDTMMDKMLTTLAQAMTQMKTPAPDDNLTNKLFNIKATSDNPEVERTVTITIKDKLVDRLESRGDQVVTEIQKDSSTAEE